MAEKLHDNEIPIDDLLVQQLVSDQFPDWSDLPLKQLGASGSSNLLYKLGTDTLVRLPRQPGGGKICPESKGSLPTVEGRPEIRRRLQGPG